MSTLWDDINASVKSDFVKTLIPKNVKVGKQKRTKKNKGLSNLWFKILVKYFKIKMFLRNTPRLRLTIKPYFREMLYCEKF